MYNVAVKCAENFVALHPEKNEVGESPANLMHSCGMQQILTRISDMLCRSTSGDRVFPSTLLFEEGWMLRLVLDWFAANRAVDHPLAFDASAVWFSEAMLTSTFLPRYRGDSHAEGFTHADGAIGHFQIGSAGHANLSFDVDGTMLKVIEAKMFSTLSAGTRRAPGYNQAARNVACMAETIRHSGRDPASVSDLSFFVLAPKQQIERGFFQEMMNKRSVEAVVRRRVDAYDEPKLAWFEANFLPTLRHMNLACLTWEDLVDFIADHDTVFGADLAAFYASCLTYNQQGRSGG